MAHAIGIDLGTSELRAAVYTASGGEHPRASLLRIGKRELRIPSAVGLDTDGTLIAGDRARRLQLTRPRSIVVAPLALLGARFDDLNLDHWAPLRLVRDARGDARVRIGERTFSPVELIAAQLLDLRRQIEETSGEPLPPVTLTVPPGLGNLARRGLVDACTIAGLHLQRLVPATTAAALELQATGHDVYVDEPTLALCDLGSGSFSASIIELREGGLTVLSSATEPRVGGREIDRRLAERLAEEAAIACEKPNIADDPVALVRLRHASERAKIDLSSERERAVHLPFLSADASGTKHLETALSQDELEGRIEDLVSRWISTLRRALAGSNRSLGDLSDVLLIGRGSHTPLVQDRLEAALERAPNLRWLDADLAALGAARLAALLAGDPTIDPVEIDEVLGRQLTLERGVGKPPSPEQLALPTAFEALAEGSSGSAGTGDDANPNPTTQDDDDDSPSDANHHDNDNDNDNDNVDAPSDPLSDGHSESPTDDSGSTASRDSDSDSGSATSSESEPDSETTSDSSTQPDSETDAKPDAEAMSGSESRANDEAQADDETSSDTPADGRGASADSGSLSAPRVRIKAPLVPHRVVLDSNVDRDDDRDDDGESEELATNETAEADRNQAEPADSVAEADHALPTSDEEFERERGESELLFPSTVTLPTSHTELFESEGDGATAHFHLHEGLRDRDGLGEYVLRGRIAIDMTFKVDANGILSLSYRQSFRGKEAILDVIGGGGMPPQEVEALAQHQRAIEEALRRQRRTQDLTIKLKGAHERITKVLVDLEAGITAGDQARLKRTLQVIDDAVLTGSLSALEAVDERLTTLLGELPRAIQEAITRPAEEAQPGADDPAKDEKSKDEESKGEKSKGEKSKGGKSTDGKSK